MRPTALLGALLLLPFGQAFAQAQSILVLPVLSSTRHPGLEQMANDLYPRLVVTANNVGLFAAVKSGTFDDATRQELLKAQTLQRFDSPFLLKTSADYNVTTLIGLTVSEYAQGTDRTTDKKGNTFVSYTASYRLSMMLVDVQTGRIMSSDSRPVWWSSGTSHADAAAQSLGAAEDAVRGFLNGVIPWWIVDVKELDAEEAPKVVLVKVGNSSWRELRPGFRLIVQLERPASLDPTTIVREQVSELEVVSVGNAVAECAVLSNGPRLRDALDPRKRNAAARLVVIRNPVQPKKKK